MEKFNIYELLYMYHCGSAAAAKMIEEEMSPLINKWVYDKVMTNRNLLGMYFDDLRQEALIGLYDSLDAYRCDKETGFVTFLKVVVERRMQNFIRSIRKHANQTVSLDQKIYNGSDDDDCCLEDVIEKADDLTSPEYALQFTEAYEILEEILENMKAREKDVLYAWIACDSLQEAADQLNMPISSFRAKFTRAKSKMKDEYHKKTLK